MNIYGKAGINYEYNGMSGIIIQENGKIGISMELQVAAENFKKNRICLSENLKMSDDKNYTKWKLQLVQRRSAVFFLDNAVETCCSALQAGLKYKSTRYYSL